MALRGEWQSLLATLDPTVALFKEDTALAQVLTEFKGWRQQGDVENGFALLVPPA